jgi:hypothetical protein
MATVHVSRIKKMVFNFFHLQGLIYTNHIPKRATVNAVGIGTGLQKFLKVLKKKKPDMAAGERYLTAGDNTHVLTAATVQDFMTAVTIKAIAHLRYSPDMAPAVNFLFPRVKAELVVILIMQLL